MKTLNASRPLFREASVSRFEFETTRRLLSPSPRSGNGGLACVPLDEWTSKLT